MLTQEQMDVNKARFIDLINSITIEGMDKTGLIKWLSSSDFFSAPASTKYHCDYAGGLCEHSLHVYDNLVRLVKEFDTTSSIKEDVDPKTNEVIYAQYVPNLPFSEDSLKIVALLHDISKANYYESYARNVKDEQGKWTQVSEYRVKDSQSRFLYGNHETTSEFMAHSFCPLTVEESIAILHHHAGMSNDCAQDDLSAILNKYPLALFLHLADMLACYKDERL